MSQPPALRKSPSAAARGQTSPARRAPPPARLARSPSANSLDGTSSPTLPRAATSPSPSLTSSSSSTNSNSHSHSVSPSHHRPAPSLRPQPAARSADVSPKVNIHTESKSDNEEKGARLKLAEELVSTEKTYVQGLKAISKGFVHRLRVLHQLQRAVLEPDEIALAFLTASDIYDLNVRLYRDLKKLMYCGELETIELPRVLTRYTPFFKLYSSFVNDYEDSAKAIVAFRASKPAFDQFMELSEKCEGKLLQDLMILPVQRIPRYVMLLQGIVKLSKPGDPALAELEQVTAQISAVADAINQRLHEQDSRQKVLTIQQSLETGKDIQLVTPTRLFIKEGLLKKRYNKTTMRLSHYKNYWFILFNDALLYTSVPKSNGVIARHKYLLRLDGMSVTDVADGSRKKDGVEETNMFEISQQEVKTFMVAAESVENKQEWMRALGAAIVKVNANKTSYSLARQATQRDI